VSAYVGISKNLKEKEAHGHQTLKLKEKSGNTTKQITDATNGEPTCKQDVGRRGNCTTTLKHKPQTLNPKP